MSEGANNNILHEAGNLVNSLIDKIGVKKGFRDLIAGKVIDTAINEAEIKDRLEKAAKIDPLTGLLNRRGFEESADLEIKQSRRITPHYPLSLLYVELDNFKKVNDSLGGHKEGDSVLKETAQFLLKEFRDTDLVGRDGGDEFRVLLVNTEIDEAAFKAEKFRINFRRYFKNKGLTVSIGVAELYTDPNDPTKNQTLESLTVNSDEAMYEAKKEKDEVGVMNDRGQIVVFEEFKEEVELGNL